VTEQSYKSGDPVPSTRSRPRGRPRDRSLPGRRREEILCAATCLFARDGFDGTDLQAVADRLGLAKGTLYRYFPSKRALFLAAVDRGMEKLDVAIDEGTAGAPGPLARIHRAIGAYLRFFREHPELCELFILERAVFRDRHTPAYFTHREHNRAAWRAFYEGIIRDGLIRDVPPERILNVLGDLVYGTMFTNFLLGRDRPPQDQARDIIDVVFQGILTPTGLGRWATIESEGRL
jgi:AcrR family transcriptional regulator